MEEFTEEQLNTCVKVLVNDYYRILSDPVEHPPTIETKRRLAAFWTLFDYYLTAEQKEKLCHWWATGDGNVESACIASGRMQ